jgi:hypothetical protein
VGETHFEKLNTTPMKEIISVACNEYAVPQEDGTLRPYIEVILILSEPIHCFDATGAPFKNREVSQVRFGTSTDQIEKLTTALKEMAAGTEKRIAKCLGAPTKPQSPTL